MSHILLMLELMQQQDVVVARQRARQIAAMLGFEPQDQTRLATAVSEVARNAFQYAGHGAIEFGVEETSQFFQVRVSDHGPGIKDLGAILDGATQAANKSMGITSVRRLMDRFQIDSTPGKGTVVSFGKALPKQSSFGRRRDLASITAELNQTTLQNPFEEAKEQNKELLRTLDELRLRQAELAQALEDLKQRESAVTELNRELEDTNRGVVALYAELEEKAEFLGRTSEMKSRFLSNMSHEFRTPLNAMTGLTRLLLDRVDGELTVEQEKQVSLIRRAAENLTDLVNDLLDIAKVESGKVSVRATEFDVSSLFGGLRGMLRPLLSANSSIDLIFEDLSGPMTMVTDESKVSQILRNFVSNALKFTEAGEIRISAAVDADESIIFSVADTGIGIAPEDQQRIFDEYIQVESYLQSKSKGTGLGLPLVKKLAAILGGKVHLTSIVGKGSTFRVTLPRVYQGKLEVSIAPEPATEVDPARLQVLVVEDNREALFIYEKYFKGSPFQVVPAQNLAAARQVLARHKPAAIVLDVLLDRENGWDFLTELKQSEETESIPVIVVTLVENEAKAIALGAHAYRAKPVDRVWLLKMLAKLTQSSSNYAILLIDDDEASRYLLKEGLAASNANVLEATTGAEGIRQAQTNQPRAIFLDLELPDQNGINVLRTLKGESQTRSIPVIINSSKILDGEELLALKKAGATAVVSKKDLSVEGSNILREALQEIGLIG